jgi:hypothetical protein
MFVTKQPKTCRDSERASRSPTLLTLATFASFIALLIAPLANAEVLLWAANSGNQTIQGEDFADFNGSATGGTSFTFTTTAPNQRVIITFDGTCYHSDAEGGVFVNILVDPAGSVGEFIAPPTNVSIGGVVLCTAEGRVNNPKQASVMASARPAQAGTNRVRVRVTSFSPTTSPTVLLQAMALAVVR